MSAEKKRLAPTRAAAGSPRKKVGAGRGTDATAESVAARLMALAQPGSEGAAALWRKADLGRTLARGEKPHLDAALERLREEGRLVELRHGESVFFAFAEALRARLDCDTAAAPAAVPVDDLMDVYRRLVRESGGFPDVKISLLARALGPSAAGLADRLTALWRTGDATLSLGDWSLASAETRAAAVEMDGEKYLLVRFEGE